MPITLTTAEQLQVHQAAERLQREFAGSLNIETVERLLTDSLDTLTERATSGAWIPLLAERFSRDRLRSLVRLESETTGLSPSILFLCVHNAGRSQMAAGWARALGGEDVEVFSGGSEPADQLNPTVIAAMAEVGVDISGEIPQPWADEIVRAADVIVTMGCGDACPLYPGKRYLDWDLDDPSGANLEQVRPIRDEIEARVRRLLADLGVAVER